MNKLGLFLIFLFSAVPSFTQAATIGYASTTLTLSICGNMLVDDGEECDVPGETGVYSQTIIGRQCSAQCLFGPYCGDGILQTIHTEECDDGNNDNGDFCSATCKIEPAGSGGGGSSGGGSSGSGGSTVDLGDTIINIIGRGYPSQTINFLLDTVSVGSVRSDSSGDFEFATDASPGTATLGIWANDSDSNRSITLNSTFDVTQGAVTNLNGILLPPTLTVLSQNINPGDQITISGEGVPNTTLELHIDDSVIIEETTTDEEGKWSLIFDTSKVTVAEHIIRARTVIGSPPLTTESTFSTSVQLFIGVEGQASLSSDLNRDGFVNLIDFSILIFWWQTDGGTSDPPADINLNGRVSLEDFSILLFNWTG
ncbi:MAG: DUF4215 domain-containing protein [Candidatus Pacebacteria bacterium]|nr:DUF4215 domain-containing protein [Candidatus Paceibacterota bacterium]